MKRTTIRIPNKLRNKIKQMAMKQDRSMNNMIIQLLNDGIKAKDKLHRIDNPDWKFKVEDE